MLRATDEGRQAQRTLALPLTCVGLNGGAGETDLPQRMHPTAESGPPGYRDTWPEWAGGVQARGRGRRVERQRP